MARLTIAATVLFTLILAQAYQSQAQDFSTEVPHAFVIDAETGAILYSKNPDVSFPPASLAKLMTLELVFGALEEGRLSPSETFFISEHAWRTGGAPSGTATMFAEVTSEVPIEALVKAIAVHGANDACIAIAEGMAGSEGEFATLMTERARELGLENSTFVNSTGLPAEGQSTTVREVVQLARHLWESYPRYYRYFSLPEFEWNDILQRNRNPLFASDIGVDGLMSGYSEQSGYALVASVMRRNWRFFVGLGGAETEEERVHEAEKIIEWTLNSFRRRELFEEGEIIGYARVYGGAQKRVTLQVKSALTALVPREQGRRLSARILYTGPLPAPIEKDDEIARLQILIDGMLSTEVPLYAAESIPRGPLQQRALDAVGELLLGWTRS